MIGVVNEKPGRGIGYKPVHFDLPSALRAHGVEGVVLFQGGPFVNSERPVNIGVNDGEFTLGERYQAEGIAKTQAAIEKKRGNDEAFKPVGNVDCEIMFHKNLVFCRSYFVSPKRDSAKGFVFRGISNPRQGPHSPSILRRELARF